MNTYSGPSERSPRAEYDASRLRVEEALGHDQLAAGDLDVLAAELHGRRSEDLSVLSPSEQADKLAEKSLAILPEAELTERLADAQASGNPLRVKYGIDPTGADVHLGHAVPMLLLDKLQRMGHEVNFIVGDFTAKIGDPTGKIASRPVLTDEDIARNMSTYSDQVRPLFDTSQVKSWQNGEWLNEFPLNKLMAILAKVQTTTLLQRRDFRHRIDNGSGITQAEMLYPVVMGLDSIHLEADIEVGGKDQLLNMQMGRQVMEICGIRPQVIIATDILLGTDGTGAKMSKSLGNYVGLTHSPTEVYGRIMSIPDSLLEQYFGMLTELEKREWAMLEKHMNERTVNPMLIKKLLAHDLVHALHGQEAADSAAQEFTAQFSKRRYEEVAVELPRIPDQQDARVSDRVAHLRSQSRSALMKLLAGGGIRIISGDGEEIKPASLAELDEAPLQSIIKVGKTVVRLTE